MSAFYCSSGGIAVFTDNTLNHSWLLLCCPAEPCRLLRDLVSSRFMSGPVTSTPKFVWSGWKDVLRRPETPTAAKELNAHVSGECFSEGRDRWYGRPSLPKKERKDEDFKIEWSYEIVNHNYDTVSQNYARLRRDYEIVCHNYEIWNKYPLIVTWNYEILVHYIEMLSNIYEIWTHTYDRISHNYKILRKNLRE